MIHPIQGPPRADAVPPQPEVRKPAGEPAAFLQTLRGAMSEVERLQADGQQCSGGQTAGNSDDGSGRQRTPGDDQLGVKGVRSQRCSVGSLSILVYHTARL